MFGIARPKMTKSVWLVPMEIHAELMSRIILNVPRGIIRSCELTTLNPKAWLIRKLENVPKPPLMRVLSPCQG